MIRPFSAVVAATLLLLAGCAGPALNTLTPSSGLTISTNLPYDPERSLRLDIIAPEKTKGAPVVVFFHGGRWSSGKKDDVRYVGQSLASQGFVVVLPDLRQYPDVRFPEFVEDAARAVAWARQQARTFGGDPDKLFVMGHSSGAHIAALLALDNRYLQAVDGSRRWLRGMIGLAGPYDFLPITAPDLRDLFGPPDRFEQSQPIFFADGRNPPLLLAHGEDDDVVFADNSRKLAEAVARSGGEAETLIYPKMSHRMIVASLAAPLRNQTDLLQHVSDFIRRRAEAPAVNPDRPDIQTTPIYIP